MIDTEAENSRRRSYIPQSVRHLGIPLPGMVRRSREQRRKTLSDLEFSGVGGVKIRAKVKFEKQRNMSQGIVSPRKFDSKNFAVWEVQMISYLTIKECADVLLKPQPKSKDLTQDWVDKNKLAKALILLSLSDGQAALVCHLDTARDIWNRLLEAHELTSSSSKVALQRKFFDAQMKPGEPVMDFVFRLQGIQSQLVQSGISLAEETLVGRIVAGLTADYHIFMTNWANCDVEQNLRELIPRLSAEESLIKKIEKSSAYAMVGESNNKSQSAGPRFSFQKAGSQSGHQPNRVQNSYKSNNRFSDQNNRNSDQNNRFNSQSPRARPEFRDFSKIKCYNCNKLGHYQSHCKAPRQKPEAVVAESIVAETVFAESNVAVSSSDWIFDSGASEHMSFDRSNFISLRTPERPIQIKMGNESVIDSQGVGDIC